MWGDITEFSSYTDYKDGPLWINGISCYAFGEGTVDLTVYGSVTSTTGVPVSLSKVLYVPDLHKTVGSSVRLLSWSAIRSRVPSAELHSTLAGVVVWRSV